VAHTGEFYIQILAVAQPPLATTADLGGEGVASVDLKHESRCLYQTGPIKKICALVAEKPSEHQMVKIALCLLIVVSFRFVAINTKRQSGSNSVSGPGAGICH